LLSAFCVLATGGGGQQWEWLSAASKTIFKT
jgi:hypothetical protein